MSPEKTKNFEHLTAVNESLRPLTPSDIDIPSMRLRFTEAGLNFDISETERRSLAEPQFRNLQSGRGVGVMAVLGQEKAESLLVWCHERSENGPKLKSKDVVKDGSEGRGLRQFAADLIQLVVNPKPTQTDIDTFCLRTNQRVLKGLLWEHRGDDVTKKSVRQAFANVPEPDTAFSSVPSGSLAELWSFLASNT